MLKYYATAALLAALCIPAAATAVISLLLTLCATWVVLECAKPFIARATARVTQDTHAITVLLYQEWAAWWRAWQLQQQHLLQQYPETSQ